MKQKRKRKENNKKNRRQPKTCFLGKDYDEWQSPQTWWFWWFYNINSHKS